MALSTILLERKETPYYRPPNLHMTVLKMKEDERVVAWVFGEGSTSPATIKTNRVAAVSDGHIVTTMTLFEDFWSKVQEGGSYIIWGYGLLGETPPYHIKFTRQTKVFRASRIPVSPDLMLEAEEALNPPSQEVDLRETLNARGLLTVCGEVVEVDSAVTIVGVTEESCQDVVELLLQDGSILEVSKEMWSPFQDQLDEGNLVVNLVVEGRDVKEIKLSN
ncbi:hypothetical protein FQA47_023931 [Oryzias melastigma]|uniref:Uncharacterized protein n=1 Tax=Oryzias melastigma TaxID=30732 RepID=A0A834C7G1_ORYME|nr:hypothetical protein FQA47_023931 [Oryzias melastigma]